MGKSRTGKNTQSDVDVEFDPELAKKCEKLLGQKVVGMEYPGGTSRDSVKILLEDGSTAFASTRSRSARAGNERRVLNALAAADANAPKLLASDSKRLLIQQAIPGVRLTEALHNKKDAYIALRLNNAVESLACIHAVGSAQGLDESMTPLGDTPGWLRGLLERPAIIGNFFGINVPAFDTNALQEILKLRKPRFVKWDARPGNAIARPDDEIFWIDWEHSGTRNRLDDLVWLLADEWVPERPDIEQKLLDTYLEKFRDDLSPEDAHRYFHALGVFHLCIRMGLIFRYKKDGKWWNYQKCLAGDKVGVTRRNLRRICRRGERWAAMNVETHALSDWFASMGAFAK
ncbi:MAG: phosphotransferase [Pseudomonadales bacterium]